MKDNAKCPNCGNRTMTCFRCGKETLLSNPLVDIDIQTNEVGFEIIPLFLFVIILLFTVILTFVIMGGVT
jgi:hypothetical protein